MAVYHLKSSEKTRDEAGGVIFSFIKEMFYVNVEVITL